MTKGGKFKAEYLFEGDVLASNNAVVKKIEGREGRVFVTVTAPDGVVDVISFPREEIVEVKTS